MAVFKRKIYDKLKVWKDTAKGAEMNTKAIY